MFDQSYTGHSNMVIAVVPPLMLLVLDSILVRQDGSARRAGLLFGALMVVQFFITEELLASEVVMVAVAVACLALMFRHRVAARRRHALGCLGWALALFVPVVAYPVWFQFFGPQVPHQVITAKNFFVTDLLNVFLPTTAQGVEPQFARDIANHYAGNSGEWGGYIGFPMLAVVGWTAWRQWRRPLVRVLCITAAAALVLSFGSTLHVAGTDTHVPLPGAILANVPVLENLVPARFAIHVALCTALLLGVFVDSLPRRRESTRLVLVTTVLVAASFVPPLPFPTRAAVTPSFFTESPSALPPGEAVLVVPFAHDFYSTQAVLWQAEAGMSFSMPEGYVINRWPSGAAGQGPPPSVTGNTLVAIAAGSTSDAAISDSTRAEVRAELRGWNVRAVVLGPADQRGAELRTFLAHLLGSPPEDVGGVAVWRAVPPP
jgi:dolichyl-phosphate beta-glucosyltransferase